MVIPLLPVSFISVIPLSHPFRVFDKVAPTGTLGNPLWKDAILDSLVCPLDNICKLRIIREVVEVPTVGTYKDNINSHINLLSNQRVLQNKIYNTMVPLAKDMVVKMNVMQQKYISRTLHIPPHHQDRCSKQLWRKS